MGLNCFLLSWSALSTLPLVWLTKVTSTFSSPRRFDFPQKIFFFFFFFFFEAVENNGWADSGTMGGQWAGSDLGFDWEQAG